MKLFFSYSLTEIIFLKIQLLAKIASPLRPAHHLPIFSLRFPPPPHPTGSTHSHIPTDAAVTNSRTPLLTLYIACTAARCGSSSTTLTQPPGASATRCCPFPQTDSIRIFPSKAPCPSTCAATFPRPRCEASILTMKLRRKPPSLISCSPCTGLTRSRGVRSGSSSGTNGRTAHAGTGATRRWTTFSSSSPPSKSGGSGQRRVGV